MGVEMGIGEAFVSMLIIALVGLMLSVIIERFMIPRPRFQRPWPAWCLHAGLWFLAYDALVLFFGRPWFATAGLVAFLLMLVLVNNAKVKALREPFVFQDYEYFIDAILYPRLYIPFLGWGKFLGAVVGFALAVFVGLWVEVVPSQRFDWSGQFGGIVVVAIIGVVLLLVTNLRSLPLSFDPYLNVQTLGLVTSLWRYGEAGRDLPVTASPFGSLESNGEAARELPHLVAVQSESFFDPRSLFAGIRQDVLMEFDRLRSDALVYGKLRVPAWGANTVRTEFAFLTGIDEVEMGVHRFNPYRAIMAGWDVLSLASFMKRLGYRTICIHPYSASFYRRDYVYPKLGFDEFLDIGAFDDVERFGPYIADAAVADKISGILDEANEPVFVFAITMENHGPLHLERAAVSDVDELYNKLPPTDCHDLTIYLRHLRNADRMVAKVRKALERCSRSAGLCWFGDHVPIMPAVYERFGIPQGDVEFIFWSNNKEGGGERRDLPAHRLSINWLRAMEIIH